MNISYNWLKEFVDFNLTPWELADTLTSIGLETGGVEEHQTIKGGLEGLFIGQVKTCIPHPNSDHLHITTVDLGKDELLQIVCGAPNVAANQKVVVATIGTKLYSEEGEFLIKKSKIRGEESFGMICAEDEIGIGTNHDGIMVLPEDAVVGTPAKDYFKVETDYILEVDITPNRIDAASHYGVARDLYAFLKQTNPNAYLRRPSIDSFEINEKDGGIPVTVENNEACPRYSGLTIKGVEVKESPDWLKNRLQLIGLRPINNVVDVTNYLLHETGQPLHCFDLNYIAGNKVIVKTLPEGTKFITLDEVEHTLSDKDLMICNAEEGMCIAGVFGGLKSGVTESTTDIFLESAYFNPTWIRKAARRQGLNTDSSFRFERGCDPNITLYVLKRAALMIQELAGGKICGEIQDIYPQKITDFHVNLSLKKVHSLIGKQIEKETIENILTSLEIKIESENEDGFSLLVPTYRVDVQRDVDVIEDILRIYGYNRIEMTDSVKSNLSYQTDTDKAYKLQNLISEQLTGSGFYEIMNNSLTKLSYYEKSELYPETHCVHLLNPLSTDLSVMRQTLLFGGLESVAYNRNRKNPDLKFYEFGNCYFFDPEKNKEQSKDNTLAGYSEKMHLGIWLTGNRVSDSWAHPDEKSTIYELKAYLEHIFGRLGVSKKFVLSEIKNEIFSQALQYNTQGGKLIAQVGVVSKQIRKQLDIDADVYFAEINWNPLVQEAKKSKVVYKEISKFPAVKRDLALLLDKNIQFAEIERVVLSTEKKLLKKLFLFDVYEGKNLPAGKKSYAVSFILQDESKTLNDKQIDAIMLKIQQNLDKQLGAQIR